MLKKYRHTSAKYFIYFLVYVAVLELIGAYPRYLSDYDFLSDIKAVFKGTLFERNYWWYTIFWGLGSVMFYSFYFMKILNTKFYIKIIKFSSIMFFLSSIIYISTHWSELFNSTMIFIEVFGATIIMLCVILYYIEMLKSDKILMFYKSIHFYICSIILIWRLVTTPVVFYSIYFSLADWDFIFLRWQIFLFANIFMYCSFTIALIWCKPQSD